MLSLNRSLHPLLRQALEAPPVPAVDALLLRFRAHSAFYRKRLRDVVYWSQAPLLDKREVSRVPVSTAYGPIAASTTSGTTGLRLTIYASRAEWRHRRLLMYRPFSFYPELINHIREAIFVDRSPKQQNVLPDRVEILGRTYYRFNVSAQASIREQWERLLAVRPHLLTGFPSAMVRFAEEAGPLAASLGIRVVSPAGELLLPAWRQLLEQAFDSPVYDRFGATETGAMAFECPACARYHLNTDQHQVEFHRKAGCVVTPLFQRVQPLLRYRLGDRLDWSPDRKPECAIKLPQVRIVDGRRDHWLYDAENRKVSPLCFEFERFAFIRRWSIEQQADGSISVYVWWENKAATVHRVEQIRRHVGQIIPRRPISVVEGKAWRGAKSTRVRCFFAPR